MSNSRCSIKNIPLKHANIEVTSVCNLRCNYCFNNSGVKKHGELSIKEWLFILDKLKKHGVKSLLFTGGEPFTRTDIWKLLEYAQNLGFETNILSNGYSLNKYLGEYKINILRNIKKAQISLDSMNPLIHDQRRGIGSWQTAINAIKFLRSLNVNVEISVTISDENIEELDAITEFAYKLNCKVLIRPLAIIGRASSHKRSTTLEEKITLKKDMLIEKYGDIFVNDFAFYAPVIHDIDAVALKRGIITIQFNGCIRNFNNSSLLV